MALLDDVKRELRISSTAFDSEILDLIDAAKLDLEISGVNKIDEVDPLIKRVITLYVKAYFGWDNPDSVKLQNAYDSLKIHLALSGDYNVVE